MILPLHKEGILMTNKHVNKYLISLVNKQIQNRITMRYFFVPIGNTKTKKKKKIIASADNNVEFCTGSFVHCCWECKIVLLL